MFLETLKSLLARDKKRRHISRDHIAQAPENSLQFFGSSATEVQLQLPALPLSSISTSNENTASHSQAPTGQIPNSSPPNGFFGNSHGLIFNQPTMVSNVFNSGGGAVMRLLAAKRISGAEVDSSARYPPPRCHADTRQELREQITRWIADPGRRWRMLYVLGAAGVGKSALAQTIAEDRKEAGYLGATCFLSRPNHRNDPDGVIPTLAHQLAVKHPIYKQIISQKLADDPTILEKDRKTQFKELIVDPFRTIMALHASTIQIPLLIIIDGLDECESEEAQCEFIELISDHVRQTFKLPVSGSKYRSTTIQPRENVMVYLRAEFTNIRLRHQDSLDDDWPLDIHFRRIATAASGLFAFASTIVRFVGDTNAGDPSKNLQTCIRMIGGSGVPGPLNPYHALDLLYRQILMSIPSAIRTTTMRILGTLLLYPPPSLTPFIPPQTLDPLSYFGYAMPEVYKPHMQFTSFTQIQANFLRITRSAFYHALKQLYSVLQIPSSSDASKDSIRFYHASFGDFLRDRTRSREFCIEAEAVHYDVAINAFHWHTDSLEKQQKDVTWVASCEDRHTCLETLRDCSLNIAWKACTGVGGDNASRILIEELQNFDFSILDTQIPSYWKFPKFLMWLYTKRHIAPAGKLIDVPTNCVSCSEVKTTYVDLPLDPLTLLTSLGLDTFNGSEGEVHCYVGDESRRRHIQIEDPPEFSVEPPSRPDSDISDYHVMDFVEPRQPTPEPP